MDSFSKYLKYKTKYLNLLNKMLQNGGYKCPKCDSRIPQGMLMCNECGYNVSSNIKQQEPSVVPEQDELRIEPSAEKMPKISEKRMRMAEQLLSNSKLSVVEPKDVFDFQEITGLDQPESVVDIMAYAGENPEEYHYHKLKETMKIFEDDEDKFDKDLVFDGGYRRYSYVSLLEDGFAIGVEILRDCKCKAKIESDCECDSKFIWIQFIADKKLSLFIIANCITIEKTENYASWSDNYCQTSVFLYGKYRRNIVKSGFEDDLPKNLDEVLKHPVVLYAAELGRSSGDPYIYRLIEDREKDKNFKGHFFYNSSDDYSEESNSEESESP